MPVSMVVSGTPNADEGDKYKGIDKLQDEVVVMREEWTLIDDLLGGTSAMIKAGERWLPKRTLEDQTDYDRRLRSATLYPAFGETLEAMTGRVFADPLTIGDDVPARIKDDIAKNVDLQGHDLNTYCKDWFNDGMAHGISYLVVDYPTVDPGVRTVAQERAINARPYWVQLKGCNIIGWRTETTNGEVRLIQVRFYESVTVPDGLFGTKEIRQIRVLEPGKWFVFQMNALKQWELTKEGTYTLKYIPLVPFYAKRTGFMTGKPPMMELAHLNRKHWKMQSDSDNLIETASVPILALVGVQKDEVIRIGAKSAVRIPMGCEIKYVEHTGKAIEAGNAALQELVEQMRQAGAKLLKPLSNHMTAEQARNEAAKEQSTLGGIVQAFEDAVDQALQITAEWLTEKEGGSIEMSPNLDLNEAPVESMQVLVSMANVGKLSDETLFNEGQRRGFITDEISWEDERDRIDLQAPDLGLTGTFPAGNPSPLDNKKPTKPSKPGTKTKAPPVPSGK